MFDFMPFDRKEKNLFCYFDHLEHDLFGDMMTSLPDFRADILDEGDFYTMKAELPGFQKEDISIDVDGDVMTVSAAQKEESEEKDKKGNYVRRERRCGSFSRRFDLSEIQADEIGAAYENGVLILKLPKKQELIPEKRSIAIN